MRRPRCPGSEKKNQTPMPITVACPVCRTALAVLPKPGALACPYCRTALKLPDGSAPVGLRVRCSHCHGIFTADSPPPAFGKTIKDASCPFCRSKVHVPAGILLGQAVKCPTCEMTFRPRRMVEEGPAPTVDSPNMPNLGSGSV